MESTYLKIEREVVRRRRWLNRLTGLRTGATLAMTVSLVYLFGMYVGLWQMIQPWWILVLANILVTWIGARWGEKRPTDLQEDLYRVDRAFQLGEQLSTIYELRRRSGGTDFLMALYRRVSGFSTGVAQALRLTEKERRGWIRLSGLTLVSLVLLAFWLVGIPPLDLREFISNSFGQNAATYPMDSSRETQSIDSQNAQGSSRTPGDLQPQGEPSVACVNRDNVAKLSQEELATAKICSNLEGSTPSPTQAPSGSDASLAAEARSLLASLSDLQDRLEEGNISSEELKQQLEQLAQDAPSKELQDALQQASKAQTPEELQRQLSEAHSKLQNQAEALEQQEQQSSASEGDASAEGAQGGSQENQGNAPQQAGENSTGEKGDQQSGGPGTGTPDQQGQKNSESAEAPGDGQSSPEQAGESSKNPADSQNQPGDSKSPSASDSQREQQSQGGNASGNEPSQGEQTASGAPSSAVNEKLTIPGGLLPRDPKLLEKLLTQGIPVDVLSPQADGTPTLRLNSERVEAILQLRDLPAELKNLVRAYFLAIAGSR